MKIALQTICWGDRLQEVHWKDLLPVIKAAGYDGIEIFQHPLKLPSYSDLRQMCRSHELRILGLTGGGLQERMDYLRPPGQEYVPDDQPEPYLYIEDWEPFCDQAEQEGFQLALHYHHLSVLSTVEESLKLLESHPNLKWLPDTAHLFIGKQRTGDLLALLTRFSLIKKTVAVHIKDWKPTFGRLSHRHARGFCKPGDGEVGLEKILSALQKGSLARGIWGVVELDHTSAQPQKDVFAAAETLHKWKVMDRKPAECGDVIGPEPLPETSEFPYRNLLKLAARGGPRFLADLAELLLSVTGAKACFVCSVLTAERQVTARMRRPLPVGINTEIKNQRDAAKALGRAVVLEKNIIERDGLLGIPLFNCFNPHAVRHVLVYETDGASGAGAICRNDDFAKAIAEAIDIYMAQRCQNIAEQASHLAAKFPDRAKMLNEIADLLRKELNCQGVTIFLAKAGLEVLEVGGTTGIRWAESLTTQNQENYTFGTGRTGEVAATRSYKIYRDELKPGESRNSRSEETGRNHGVLVGADVCSVLSACFFNEKDEVAGVVRCRNPISENSDTVMYFSEDDLALVEAAMLAVQPELETYAQDLRAMIGYEVLMHELTNPLYFVRSAALRAHRAIAGFQEATSQVILKHDYLDQIGGWLDLIAAQLEAFQHFVQGKLNKLTLSRESTYFFADIVAPMVAQFRIPLAERGFSIDGISYGNEDMWKGTPRLYIDRKLFGQVVSNLLNNAIKYARRDPKLFGVKIWGEATDGFAEIHFQDQGIGIEAGWSEAIFTRGGRIVTREREQIHGYGLGLWLARQIVELHGGTLTLTKWLPEPTQFTIRLPLGGRSHRGTDT